MFQHFVGGQGPTEEWPNPLPADWPEPTKPRRTFRRCFPGGRKDAIVKKPSVCSVVFYCPHFRTIIFADFLYIHDDAIFR